MANNVAILNAPVNMSAPDVLRALGERHKEQKTELLRLAEVIDRMTSWPMTTDKMKRLTSAWSRGVYWCNVFRDDDYPLVMP